MYNVNQVNQLFVVSGLLKVLDMYANTTAIAEPTNNQIIWAEANSSSEVAGVYKYSSGTTSWALETTGTYALSNGTFVTYASSAWTTTTPSTGTLTVHTTPDGEMMYFKYVGEDPDENPTFIRSDLIPLKVVKGSHDLRYKATTAKKMEDTMASAKITISSTAADIIAGETYGFRVILPHLFDEGDESIYTKYAYVKAVSGDNKASITRKLAQSLYINLDRIHKNDIFKVYLGTTEITKTNANLTTISGDDISIVAVPQPWKRGLMPQTKIAFEISWNPITKDGEDYMDWMSVAMDSANAGITIDPVSNGKKIADLEYFLMGERGDQYRMMGYPNFVETKYLVNPSSKYDVLSIHYSFIGHNEDNKRGEKDLTFVIPTDETTDTLGSVASALNTAILAILS